MSFWDNYKLSQKQFDKLHLEFISKRSWKDKKPHVVRQINSRLTSWNIEPLVAESTLEDFLKYLESQIPRLRREYYKKKACDSATESFEPIVKPVIGTKCHVSYLHRGAQFVIRAIDNTYAYLDNPKHKRATLLKAKLTDLRKLRKKK